MPQEETCSSARNASHIHSGMIQQQLSYLPLNFSLILLSEPKLFIHACTHTHTQELCLHVYHCSTFPISLYVYVCICIYVLWYTKGYIYTCSLCTKYTVCSVWWTIFLKHTSLPLNNEKYQVSIQEPKYTSLLSLEKISKDFRYPQTLS